LNQNNIDCILPMCIACQKEKSCAAVLSGQHVHLARPQKNNVACGEKERRPGWDHN